MLIGNFKVSFTRNSVASIRHVLVIHCDRRKQSTNCAHLVYKKIFYPLLPQKIIRLLFLIILHWIKNGCQRAYLRRTWKCIKNEYCVTMTRLTCRRDKKETACSSYFHEYLSGPTSLFRRGNTRGSASATCSSFLLCSLFVPLTFFCHFCESNSVEFDKPTRQQFLLF